MTEVWSASTVRRLAAAALEQQRFAGTAGRWLARGYQRWADPVRPLRLTPWASRDQSLVTRAGLSAASGNHTASGATLFVGVGGARLGGNHKTPFVLALARALTSDESTAPRRVAVVVSGYGSRARRAIWVNPEHAVPDVSDEARWLAGELVPRGARVVTAASRQAALDLAASWADCVIPAPSLVTTSDQRSARLVNGGHIACLSDQSVTVLFQKRVVSQGRLRSPPIGRRIRGSQYPVALPRRLGGKDEPTARTASVSLALAP